MLFRAVQRCLPGTRIALALATGMTLCALAACGDADTSDTALEFDGNSTCDAFLSLDTERRTEEAMRLSEAIGVRHGGNPLWTGRLAAACSVEPTLTLAEAFGRDEPLDEGDRSPEQPPAPAFEPKRTYRGSVLAGDGSTFDLSFKVGEVQRVTDPIPAGFTELSSVCTLDEQRDAVQPVAITAQSTSEQDFNQDIRTGLILRGFNAVERGDVYPEVAVGFSEPKCVTTRSGAYFQHRVTFPDRGPGEDGTHEMLVVLHDYYTPDAPSGRRAEYDEIYAATPQTGDVWTCWDGPDGSPGFFHLAGSTEALDRDGLPSC